MSSYLSATTHNDLYYFYQCGKSVIWIRRCGSFQTI